MAEDYEMVKDDNSHEEGRNVGMDELQFDDIDSILSSEPENLNINPDPLESLVASSGEDYPSSFENDFVFHPEETTGSANFNIEDTLDLELTDPLVDAEIDKLLDINDITSISEISNLESDDSFFIPGDSAPDDGIDFSELDNSLTEEPDAFSFGEESEDLEGFELSDQNEELSQEDDFLGDEEGPIALSKTELGEIAPAVEDDLPDFISTSVDSEIEEENIAESMLGGTSVEADVLPDSFLDELEEDAPIALSGDELDNILNAPTADDSDDDLPDFITHVENEDFSLPVEQDSSLLPSDTISNSSLFEDFEEEEKISLPEHELEEIENPVLSEEDSLSFEDFELPTNDLETSEISLEDEEANEPIALSDEELGNLLASENEEPTAMSEESNDLADWDSSPTSEISLEDEEANEPIALSDEELGNLLASENEEPTAISEESNDLADSIDWNSSPTSEISLEDEEANEPIALSNEELGNLLASENEEPTAMSEESNDLADSVDWDSSPTSEISLEDEEANEPIALSDEELGNLLASENEELTTSEESNDLADSVDWDSSPTSEISLEDEEANEPIALSDEELGNLLASENEEPTAISEESNDLADSVDWDSPPTSEISLEDEESNEPIALSNEELGNLLASENEELTTSEESNDLADSVDWDSPPTSEISLEDEEANEPIALSDEELGNLLASENEEPTAMSEESNDLADSIDWNSSPASEISEISLEDEEANEPIALSLDELDHILTDENEEPAAMSEESNDLADSVDWDSPPASEISEISLEDEEASEPIALSLDELDHILTDENEEPAAMSEESNDLADSVDWDSSPASEISEISLEDEEASEPIALSLDELDHILTDENEEPAAMSEESNDLADSVDWDSPPASEISLEDEEASEPIAFSDEELGNLLASGNEESEDKIGSNIPKVETEEDLSEILGELPPVSDLDAFDSIDEDVSKEEEVSAIVPTLESVKDQEMIIVLDEYADEEEPSPIEELRKTPDQTEAIAGELSGDVPSKDEMKRIMTYLDELLGNLPDDLIREFSRSDYFELYKKLMKQIGV
ncbi:hypothetical protein LEP1GSC115_4089 [Leptospira interrogans serovar Australis str. 200703203]|uniref:Uncharacterized protein n=1 Tax=Leptospira interrogans serovar Australis str. 200703203 TaxID=1085541 RepID=N1UGV1_LEPIR|nr:hypothetical protein LEP1GSC115_4089 [Leptospira interrogans serovar Australis str. 200703203]